MVPQNFHLAELYGVPDWAIGVFLILLGSVVTLCICWDPDRYDRGVEDALGFHEDPCNKRYRRAAKIIRRHWEKSKWS